MFELTQNLVTTGLWVIFLVIKGWAALDCLRRRQDAFPAVGRQTKMLWLILTGVALLTGLLPGLTLTIFGLAGVVVSLIYLFDVRPRIAEITS